MKEIFCVILIASILLTGCSKVENKEHNADSSLTGFVVKKNDGRFLLVSQDADSNNDYSANWVITKEEVNLGQLVEVFVRNGEINASDPGLVTANKINVLDNKIESISNQEVSEALEKALLRHTEFEVPIVKNLSYSDVKKEWSIVLFDKKAIDKKETIITVKD